MHKGNLTREQAIAEVGVNAVVALDALHPVETGRVQCDGDTDVEFEARIKSRDRHGDGVTLSAWYYQPASRLTQGSPDAVDSLDELDWTIDGYSIA